MSKNACVAWVAVALSLTSGCASLVANGPVHVPVTSRPAGATVFLNDQPAGQTPMVVDLKSSLPRAELRLELPGFESVRVTRGKKLNGWVWGNLIIGGLIGIAIDFASGAAQRFDGTPINVELKPGDGEPVRQLAPPQPAPPLVSDADCKEQRRIVLAEAMDIQNAELRLKKLRTAPICKA
jgi:hypothetical protein